MSIDYKCMWCQAHWETTNSYAYINERVCFYCKKYAQAYPHCNECDQPIPMNEPYEKHLKNIWHNLYKMEKNDRSLD